MLLRQSFGEAQELVGGADVAIPTNRAAGGANFARICVLMPALAKREGYHFLVTAIDAHLAGSATPGNRAVKNRNALVSRAHGKPKRPQQKDKAKAEKERRHIAEAIDDHRILDRGEGVILQPVANREVQGEAGEHEARHRHRQMRPAVAAYKRSWSCRTIRQLVEIDKP